MRRRGVLLGGLFVAALIIGLAVFLPARTVAGWIAPIAPQVQLHGVTGTAMRAKVQTLLAAALPGVTVAEDVTWRMQPWRLLTARAGGKVTADLAGGEVEGVVAASAFGGYAVDDLRGVFALQDILALAKLDGVGITGRVGVDLERVRLKQAGDALEIRDASGQIDLVDLGWRFGPKRYAIGDFTLVPRVEDGVLIGAVADDNGPVAAEGTVRFNPADNTYAADLRVRPRSTADPVLANLMSGSMGRADTQGWFTIKQNGTLRR